MIYRLNPDVVDFPDPHDGDEDGLFAVGGDLSVDRLVLAYYNGIFPWYAYRKEDNSFQDENGEPWIQWWCPMDRFVIFPKEIHISHSMRTLLRKERYHFSFGRAFDKVIRYCGSLREKEVGAWLGPDIIKAYTDLYNEKICTSVEVWEDVDPDTPDNAKEPEGGWYYDNNGSRLVGGLYGEMIGGSFIGESMFSLVPSGSKLALIFLASWMAEHDGKMIDCQLETPHLKSMGGRHITYDEYIHILRSGCGM